MTAKTLSRPLLGCVHWSVPKQDTALLLSSTSFLSSLITLASHCYYNPKEESSCLPFWRKSRERPTPSHWWPPRRQPTISSLRKIFNKMPKSSCEAWRQGEKKWYLFCNACIQPLPTTQHNTMLFVSCLAATTTVTLPKWALPLGIWFIFICNVIVCASWR